MPPSLSSLRVTCDRPPRHHHRPLSAQPVPTPSPDLFTSPLLNFTPLASAAPQIGAAPNVERLPVTEGRQERLANVRGGELISIRRMSIGTGYLYLMSSVA